MNFKEELAKLVVLQEEDTLLYNSIQTIEKTIPEEIAELKDELKVSRSELTNAEEKLKGLQLVKKDKELTLAAKEEAIHKAQTQLYQLKTNKEYQAKLSEIESLKADISSCEELVLKALEGIEAAQADVNKASDAFKEVEQKFTDEISVLENKAKELNAEIEHKKEKRAGVTKDVDKKILEIYEKLLNKRGGVALAPISNGTCGACYMHVMPQIINSIKMYDELVFCPSCMRILYIHEDLSL